MTLTKIGTVAGGVDDAGVSVMEKRFEKRLLSDDRLKGKIEPLEEMLNVET